MHASLEFLFRLLDSSCPADFSPEELDGPCGEVLRVCQRMGFLAAEPGKNPVASCPHCQSGTAYRQNQRFVCNRCRSTIDVRELYLWRFDLRAFLNWYCKQQRLSREPEQIDDCAWRLGTLDTKSAVHECFYLRGKACSDLARRRLSAFRSVLILHGKSEPPSIEGIPARMLLMAETLSMRGTHLTVRRLGECLGSHRRLPVRFDPRSGTLCLGDAFLAKIAAGTREFAFVERLAAAKGEVIAYADLKRAVSLATGSIDSRDEATFCHRLKSRLKKNHSIPMIERLIEADPSMGGYRLVRETVLADRGGESWESGKTVGGMWRRAGC
jgi:hypothetical protein